MSPCRLAASIAALTSLAVATGGCGTATPGLADNRATPASHRSSSARPTLAHPTTGGSPPALAGSPNTAKPGLSTYAFPVGGKPISYARTHHDYPATDIIAACGLPVRAVTDGVVLEVSRVDKYKKATNDGALRGGLSVSILGDDGVRYYGSHLGKVNAGIEAGRRVHVGQQIGTVGRTGNTSTCHLHFGISPVCQGTADWWNRRGVVWPYRFLDAWRAGKDASPAAEVAAWKAEHGCPAKAP